MTMITPSYLGETIEYSSLHACRSTLEDPTSQYRECPGAAYEWPGRASGAALAEPQQRQQLAVDQALPRTVPSAATGQPNGERQERRQRQEPVGMEEVERADHVMPPCPAAAGGASCYNRSAISQTPGTLRSRASPSGQLNHSAAGRSHCLLPALGSSSLILR